MAEIRMPPPLPPQIERWQIAGYGMQGMRRGRIVAGLMDAQSGLYVWVECSADLAADRAVIVVQDGGIPPAGSQHVLTVVTELRQSGPGYSMTEPVARHLYEIIPDQAEVEAIEAAGRGWEQIPGDHWVDSAAPQPT